MKRSAFHKILCRNYGDAFLLKKNIKISKENIPAATQLFTPDWIVRYMVENSTHMIAVCNGGEACSTKYSVEYAVSRGLEVVVINPKDVSCYEIPRLRNFKLIK